MTTPVIDVAALRARLGLTQAELARRLGVDTQTVWRWEAGMHQPKDRKARRVLARLAEKNAKEKEK